MREENGAWSFLTSLDPAALFDHLPQFLEDLFAVEQFAALRLVPVSL